jgi:UrcA family protein
MRKLLLTAVAAAALGGPALAETHSVKLQTASVDFADRAQVKRLYTRLTAAAIRVCSTPTDELYGVRPDRACVDKAVANAVSHIDQPRLTAMLQSNHVTATAEDDR